MAAGGSSFVRNFGVRLVVLESDSFVRANQQVVQANKAQADSLDAVGRAQRRAAGEASGLIGGLRGLAANVAILDGPLGGVASRINAFATSISKAGIGLVGIGVLTAGAVFTFRKMIPVVSELEQHMARMQGVMQATGGQIGLTSQQIEDFSQQIGGGTLATIGEVRQAFIELATSGIVFGDTAVRTVQVSQDLAQVFGGTLAQNMDLLQRTAIKVISGVEGFRERFGIQIPAALQRSIQAMQDLGDTQGAMDALLDFLSARVAGQGALGAADTLAGAFQEIKEAFDNFLESFTGGDLVEGLKDFLRTTAGEIRDITAFINEVEARGGWIRALIGDTTQIDRVLAFFQAVRGGVGEVRESLGETFAPSPTTRAAGEAFGQIAKDLFSQSPAVVLGDADRLLNTAERELGIVDEVAQIRRKTAAEELLATEQRFAIAQDQVRVEEQKVKLVQTASFLRQNDLAIDAAQKGIAEANDRLAKERLRREREHANQLKQEAQRVEGIIERLESRLIDLRGGSTFEQIEAREGGTAAFEANRGRIQNLAIRGDDLDLFQKQLAASTEFMTEARRERIEEFQDKLKASNDFINEGLREQRSAVTAMSRAIATDLVGAWRNVTDAIIEGGNVGKEVLSSLLNIATSLAERVAVNALTMGIAGATTPGAARFLGFAHGGSFTVGDATGSSVIHMLPPKQKGIFAGRAQRGLDFMVPGGGGAADSVPVSFLATPGERVNVTPPGRGGVGADLNLNINVTGGNPDQQAMLEVFGSHLVEQAVSRSVGRTLDLVTRDRTVRRIVRGGRR